MQSAVFAAILDAIIIPDGVDVHTLCFPYTQIMTGSDMIGSLPYGFGGSPRHRPGNSNLELRSSSFSS
jgi:hypothetical protein